MANHEDYNDEDVGEKTEKILLKYFLIITRPDWASNDDGSNDSIIDHVVVDIF